MKKVKQFQPKIVIFTAVKNRCMLHGHVFVMDISCLNGYFWILFLQKCLLSSPLSFISLLSKSLNFIGCQGDKKGKFRKKMLKNLLFKHHTSDEAVTFHTCL